jgi:hypothetical protein
MPETLSRSPDGQAVVEATAVPMRTSHEVYPLVMRDLEGDRVVASFEDTMWSVDEVRWHDTRVALTLRKYPNGLGTVTATVDLEDEMATVRGRTVPVGGLERALT